jgi:hypothetical protein
MKYQVGDKVIVLFSEEEATVVDLINDKMVLIEVRGVQFPAYMDQIDFPYFKQFTQKKEPAPKKKIYIDELWKEKGPGKVQVGQGVWLNFLPVYDKDVFDDDVVEKFRLYLVNQTKDELHFSYAILFNGQNDFELVNNILPLSDFYLHDVAFEDLNDSPRFDFEFTLARPDKKRAPYFEASLKLKAKQLFKKIEEIQQSNEPSFSYPLMDHYPVKEEAEKVDLLPKGNKFYRTYDLANIKQMLEPARTMIDLHIEKLVDDHSRMSGAEKLELQLKTFEKYYDLAVAAKLPAFIVVHGIGSGKLRDEVHELLRLKSDVKSFVNQYHPSYGYGATEIYFK